MDLSTIIVGVTLGVVGSYIAAELHAGTGGLARWIKDFAVGQLPESQQERRAEEWAAHLDQSSTHLHKLWDALGFLLAAWRVPRPKTKPAKPTTVFWDWAVLAIARQRRSLARKIARDEIHRHGLVEDGQESSLSDEELNASLTTIQSEGAKMARRLFDKG